MTLLRGALGVLAAANLTVVTLAPLLLYLGLRSPDAAGRLPVSAGLVMAALGVSTVLAVALLVARIQGRRLAAASGVGTARGGR